MVLTGSFGGYVNGYPTTGTVTGGSYSVNGTSLFSFSNASISVPDFRAYVEADDIVGLFDHMLRAADQLIGSSGVDVLFGFGGNDTIDGRGGNDHLIGGLGNDSYRVNSAGDQLYEGRGEGVDTVYSTAGTYALPVHEYGYVENLTYVGTGSFTGTGNGLNNVIRGAGGHDQLDGGAGADTMYGGGGNDRYTVDNGADRAIESSASGGTDTVVSSVTFRLGLHVERLTLTGTANANAVGNELANALVGNGGANILDGRSGADTMNGGAGNDIYVVDNAADRAIEDSSAGGTDLVRSSVDFLLRAHVENLTLTGSGAVDGTGNGSANIIIGNGAANILNGAAGADRLDGAGGNDTLNGGAGNDSLRGAAGADKFLFDTALNPGSNVDQVVGFSVADDTIVLDQTIFSQFGTGMLSAGAFVVGTSAQDANDRIIYDSATGRIFYDGDGNGSGAAVQFAHVAAGLALTNADFQIIG